MAFADLLPVALAITKTCTHKVTRAGFSNDFYAVSQAVQPTQMEDAANYER
jgi:hypothetical protein